MPFSIDFPIPDGWYVSANCSLSEHAEDENCIVLEGTSFDPQESTILSGGFFRISSRAGSDGIGEENQYLCEGIYPKTMAQGIKILECTEQLINGHDVYYEEIVNSQYADFNASKVIISKNNIVKMVINIRYNRETKKQVLDYYPEFIQNLTSSLMSSL